MGAVTGLCRSGSLGSMGSSPTPLASSGLATMRAWTSASSAALSPCMLAIKSDEMKFALQPMSADQHIASPGLACMFAIKSEEMKFALQPVSANQHIASTELLACLQAHI